MPAIVETGIAPEDFTRIPDAARRVESLGFDTLVMPEINRDPFLALTLVAEHTQRVGMITSVAIAFPRSPMVTAQISWDLQRYSNGRFALGLGSQVRKHNEERFSVKWSAPVKRMREYIQTMRAIWDSWQNGTKPSFVGEHYRYTYMTPFFNPGPLENPHVPVHVSAVNPAMCRLAGEICDGVRLHGFCTRRYLDEVILPNIEEGAKKAGRNVAEIELSGGGFLATGPTDEAVDKQLEVIRTQISFYGSTPAYHSVFVVHGWQDLGDKLNKMSREGRWQEMAKSVPDDVVRTFAVAGRYDQIAPRIRERYRGIERLSLPLPSRDKKEEEQVRGLIAELHH